jgi:hypothetical protein
VKDARDDTELLTRPWGGSEKPLVRIEEWTLEQWITFKYPEKPEIKTLWDTTLEDIRLEVERRGQTAELKEQIAAAKKLGVL